MSMPYSSKSGPPQPSNQAAPAAPAKTASARERLLGMVALFTGATAIGVAPILVRLSETGPSATAGFRVLFALPILWLIILLAPAPERALLRSPRALGWLALTGLLFAGDLGLWHWALTKTTVANATLLTNSAPVFVVLGAWLFLREKIRPGLLLGLLIAFTGGAILLSESLRLSRAHLAGDIIAICGAVFYAGYLVSVKRLRGAASTAIIMGASGIVSCLAFFTAAAAAGENLLPETNRGWIVLIAMALICHLGGQGLIAYALAHLPASFSSVTLLWQPVVATLLAALLLSEPLTLPRLLGGAIILTGIAIALRQLPQSRRKEGKPPD